MLTLTLLAHLFAAVLSTYMWMCAKGAILGTKSRSCMSSAPSSRSFIVTSHLGLEEYTRRVCIVREKGEHQTKYWTSRSWHTPTITDTDKLVVPIQVGGKGSNSRRWVGLISRLRNNSHQASNSSCTSVVSWTCLPAALLRSCCTRVNMPLDLVTAGVILRSSPRSLIHLRKGAVRTFLGMAASVAANFSCRLGGEAQ